MKILIIVAMNAELEGFLNRKKFAMDIVQGFLIYSYQQDEMTIYLAKSEVGKVNAALLTTALILKIKPRYIINAGIAGALNQNIPIFTTIASSKIAYHDFDLTAFQLKRGELDNHDLFFKGSRKLLDCCNENVLRGLIVSGDQFLSTREQLNQIKKDFPKALCCDMEGCAIAHVATYLKRKFLVIRTISDNIYQENQVCAYQDNKPKAIEKVVEQTFYLIENLKKQSK